MAVNTHNIVTTNELTNMLRAFLNTIQEDDTASSALPPPMIWGAPGVGKSTLVKSVAEEMGLGFIDLRLAQMESIDIRGLPIPDVQKKIVNWFPSATFPTENEKGGILFLDEFSAAPRDVQVASYELILDRQLGGGKIYKLPSKWMIVAAGNRTTDGAVAMRMSSALATRVMHLDVEANAEEWTSWATSHDIFPSVWGFINFKPELLFTMEKQNLERGWPTPRSWERVSTVCKVLKDETQLRKAVYGLVGVPAGQQFIEFNKLSAEMNNVLDLMLDEKKPVKVPTQDDRKWAMTSAMVYHVWRGKDKKDIATRAEGFVRLTMHLPPAFAVMAMTAAKGGSKAVPRSEAVMYLMRTKNYKDWRQKFGQNLSENFEV